MWNWPTRTDGKERRKKEAATLDGQVAGLTSKGTDLRGLSYRGKRSRPLQPPARNLKFIERGLTWVKSRYGSGDRSRMFPSHGCILANGSGGPTRRQNPVHSRDAEAGRSLRLWESSYGSTSGHDLSMTSSNTSTLVTGSDNLIGPSSSAMCPEQSEGVSGTWRRLLWRLSGCNGG